MSFVDLAGHKVDVSNRQSDPLEPAVNCYLAARRGREAHIVIWRTRITSNLSVRFIAKAMGVTPGYVSKVSRRVTAALRRISQELNPCASNLEKTADDEASGEFARL